MVNVKCPNCNRTQTTNKDIFQCRKPSGCGKRSRTADFVIQVLQQTPSQTPTHQTIIGTLVYDQAIQ